MAKKLKTMNEISAAEAVKLFQAAVSIRPPTTDHSFEAYSKAYRLNERPYSLHLEAFPKDMAARDFIESLNLFLQVVFQIEANPGNLGFADLVDNASDQVNLYSEERAELTDVAADIPERTLEKLTQKERAVFDLLKKGLSDKEISHELKRSIHTIKAQLRSVYKKLDVHSRTEALAKSLPD